MKTVTTEPEEKPRKMLNSTVAGRSLAKYCEWLERKLQCTTVVIFEQKKKELKEYVFLKEGISFISTEVASHPLKG